MTATELSNGDLKIAVPADALMAARLHVPKGIHVATLSRDILH